jgi:hypothetical protein
MAAPISQKDSIEEPIAKAALWIGFSLLIEEDYITA